MVEDAKYDCVAQYSKKFILVSKKIENHGGDMGVDVVIENET